MGRVQEITSALEKLLNLKWNYLVVPEIDDDSITFVSAWIKEQRAKQKTFKVVLPNYRGYHEAIINFRYD